MNRLIDDLRFFIGAFFLIVGVLLVGQGLWGGAAGHEHNVNLLTGLVFMIFAAGALLMSFRANRRG